MYVCMYVCSYDCVSLTMPVMSACVSVGKYLSGGPSSHSMVSCLLKCMSIVLHCATELRKDLHNYVESACEP